MSFTLQEAGKLTQDMLQRGVIETMAKTSGVLQRLPFVEVVGSGYTYNILKDLPAVNYRTVNAGYGDGPMTTLTETTEKLTILGANADTDVFLQRTHSNFTDLRALEVESTAKSVARQFEKDFFNADGTSNKLKGLEKRLKDDLAGTEIRTANANVVTLDELNILLDHVIDGADAMFMSKKMRREIMKLLQANSHYIQNGTDEFGRMVEYYGGVPIIAVEDSLIPAGRIYAVKFGADQYVSGLSNGGVQVRDLGELQTKPVFRTVIEFYCGLATKHTKCFAVLNASNQKIHDDGSANDGSIQGAGK